jgi:hypothetical protein
MTQKYARTHNEAVWRNGGSIPQKCSANLEVCRPPEVQCKPPLRQAARPLTAIGARLISSGNLKNKKMFLRVKTRKKSYLCKKIILVI